MRKEIERKDKEELKQWFKQFNRDQQDMLYQEFWRLWLPSSFWFQPLEKILDLVIGVQEVHVFQLMIQTNPKKVQALINERRIRELLLSLSLVEACFQEGFMVKPLQKAIKEYRLTRFEPLVIEYGNPQVVATLSTIGEKDTNTMVAFFQKKGIEACIKWLQKKETKRQLNGKEKEVITSLFFGEKPIGAISKEDMEVVFATYGEVFYPLVEASDRFLERHQQQNLYIEAGFFEAFGCQLYVNNPSMATILKYQLRLEEWIIANPTWITPSMRHWIEPFLRLTVQHPVLRSAFLPYWFRLNEAFIDEWLLTQGYGVDSYPMSRDRVFRTEGLQLWNSTQANPYSELVDSEFPKVRASLVQHPDFFPLLCYDGDKKVTQAIQSLGCETMIQDLTWKEQTEIYQNYLPRRYRMHRMFYHEVIKTLIFNDRLRAFYIYQ